MTGALIQLVAKGIQDIFITRDPQITYFKIIYRRHTNFSLEAIPQYFTHKPDFGKKVTCTLAPNGDLVGKTHLVATLPKIKPFFLVDGTIDPYTKFAWVKKIGYALIKSIEIEIGGQLLDRQYGDWLNIITELFVRKEDRGLDKMIGNIEKLYSFTQTKDKYTLYIPLQFWFCRTASLAIPIICLHHSEVKINLELNDLENCHLLTPTNYLELEDNLCSFKSGEYIYQTIDGVTASALVTDFDPITRKLYYKRISRNKFLSLPYEEGQTYALDEIFRRYPQYIIRSRTTTNFAIPKLGATPKIYNNQPLKNVSLQECYLLVTYVFLDNDERNRFVQNKHEYLIDQLHLYNTQTITASNYSAKADSKNPTKFMVWYVIQQYFTDKNNNDYFNYTDDYMYNYDNNKYTFNGKSLITEEGIMFNGYDRISKRTYKYFNFVQPNQHLDVSLPEGLNFYSFSLTPKEFQPSGTCNSSHVGQTEIKLNLNTIINDKNNGYFKGYTLAHNVFRIVDGLCGLVFI